MLHHLNGMAYIYSFGKHHSKEKVSKYSGGSRQISVSAFRSQLQPPKSAAAFRSTLPWLK
jgi:hypothetical protein